MAQLSAVLAFDRAGLAPVDGLRAAAGVVVPLVVGVAAGHPAEGAQAAVGALPVGIAELTGAFRAPLGLMLATSAGMTASTFVGSLTAGRPAAAVAVLALVGLMAGLLVALGRAATIVGIQAVLALVVFGRFPGGLVTAAAHAGWVLAGALVQTAVALLLRDPRPLRAQRDALAAAYGALAGLADGVLAGASAVPAAEAIATAAALVARRAEATVTGGDELRGLVDEARRIRLELQAVTSLAGAATDAAAVTAAAHRRLGQLAAALEAGRPPPEEDPELAAVVSRLRERRSAGVPEGFVAARAGALLGQLRAAHRLATLLAGVRELPLPRVGGVPAALRLGRGAGSGLRRLRLALDPADPALRHAVRLGVLLPLADVLARLLPGQRGYWVALTAAVVLKPDYVATLRRGVARVGGTLAGVVLVGLLVAGLHPRGAALVVLVAVFAWASYTLFAASYVAYTFVLTGLVVCLVATADPRPLSVVADRGLDTVVGGALALLAYRVWPTPEAPTLRATTGRLLGALADYAETVLCAYVDPVPARLERLPAAALAARRARAEALASLERARAEPGRLRPDVEPAVGLLAAARRIVVTLHAMRTTLQDAPRPLPLAEVDAVCAEVTASLRALAGGGRPVGALRARQQELAALADAAAGAGAGDARARRLAVVAAHLDPLVDGIDTLAAVLPVT